MTSLSSKIVCLPCLLFAMANLLGGCATSGYGSWPFFISEQDVETHGRKSGLDKIIESDPGRVDFTVTDDYQQNPPRQIAVLPFVDKGYGEYVVDKIPLGFRDAEERNQWAWTH